MGGRSIVEEYRSALLSDRPTIITTAGPVDSVMDFATSVADGLAREPREVECRFLYDEHGSRMYERITEQPEYYPTRTEAGILARHAGRLPDMTGPVTLVELGSGSSEKTRRLLEAYRETCRPLCYVPVDVSATALEQASRAIVEDHPHVRVIAVHGRYEDAFPLLAEASPCMLVFLGSTIGNLDEQAESSFWARVADHMRAGDHVLLGVDLVKDAGSLEAAYNDRAGVTGEFSRNLFSRMNRELGADIDIEHIEHLARWNPRDERIEIDVRFLRDQEIRIAPLGETRTVREGEHVRVEISRKFDLEKLRPRLRAHGFGVRDVYTDDRSWFALLLLERLTSVTEADVPVRRRARRGRGESPAMREAVNCSPCGTGDRRDTREG